MERKITIEEEAIYQEDYQMRMLRENQIEGLLKVKGRGADNRSYYDYDVSGKISMHALYERNEISTQDLKEFLSGLLKMTEEVEKYLLNKNCLLLEPEYIYYEEGAYYFCYYPPGKGNLWEAFHRLTEYFVKKADYKDQECIQTIFLLHKETMKENYSLEKLAQQCLRQEDEENLQEGEEATMMNMNQEEYDMADHDWIAKQEMGSTIMERTENMWTPVKQFLNRHKKSKWGDWDGLYIEEEEL